MDRISNALKSIASNSYMRPACLPAIEDYIANGDKSALKAISKSGQYSYWEYELVRALAAPDEWTDADRRVIHIAAKVGEAVRVMSELDTWLGREKPGQDFLAEVRRELALDDAQFAAMVASNIARYQNGDSITSAGRFILSMDPAALRAAIEKAGAHGNRGCLARLLAIHARDKAKILAPVLLKKAQYGAPTDVVQAMMEIAPEVFEPDVLQACKDLKHSIDVFDISQVLYNIDPEKYQDVALTAGRNAIAGHIMHDRHAEVTGWMLEKFGAEIAGDMLLFFKRDREALHAEPSILNKCVATLGAKAEPIVLAAIERPIPEATDSNSQASWKRSSRVNLRLTSVQHLITIDAARHDAIIERELTQFLEPRTVDSFGIEKVISALSIASKWQPKRVEPLLWQLLDHKSKQLRGAVARTLGKLADAALPKAAELLRAKKADTRESAVWLLTSAGTDKALAELEKRLDDESSDDVRDQILLALSAAWEKQGRKVARQDIARRIEKTRDKLKDPVAPWADPARLPAPRWKDGAPLTRDEAAYLIYRQSRAKEIAADIEAAPMIGLLDRAGSGEFARGILQGFLASKQEASDKWALSIAGLLGDDRLVPPIIQQIRDWVDHNRGKLAEYAVQALALIGTDAALLAVDAMAIRYRSKMKNVGRAASEAFIEAARKLGITPEELGDRVVPWLGFEPGKPRIITAGKTRIEASIGIDLKLAFKDLEKNKPIKTLPKSAGNDVLSEFKDLSANLREIVKAQTLRLENLLVRQRRWPVGRWKELFLQHPLLLPIAVRLVWGCYDDQGKRIGTFRALQDRSLTTCDSDPFELPAKGTVGMLHPLELAEADRTAWRNHLADYEIEPPFPQMERDVVQCKPEQQNVRVYSQLAGTSINAMTFKGRAERLGWYRGSVCDGGGITSYYKSFPAAGTDVFLGLEDFYMGIDMYSNIKLGDVMFVRSGSVQVGSYTYDEPSNENDPRVLAMGQVPAIVFSETMGDLQKIAATKEGQEES